MKIQLPKLNNFSKGFTLIELMVVVAIIAILAVVGFAIFSNAQAIARDGIRREEINNLAKSIETSKDPTVVNYVYTDTANSYQAEYPNANSRPRDPSRATWNYCMLTSTAQITPPTVWASTDACPTGYASFITSGDGVFNGTGNLNGAGARDWMLCARLEVPGSPFCQGNIR